MFNLLIIDCIKLLKLYYACSLHRAISGWSVDACYGNNALDDLHNDPIWIFYMVSMVDL